LIDWWHRDVSSHASITHPPERIAYLVTAVTDGMVGDVASGLAQLQLVRGQLRARSGRRELVRGMMSVTIQLEALEAIVHVVTDGAGDDVRLVDVYRTTG
jgi:hypothetical protein